MAEMVAARDAWTWPRHRLDADVETGNPNKDQAHAWSDLPDYCVRLGDRGMPGSGRPGVRAA